MDGDISEMSTWLSEQIRLEKDSGVSVPLFTRIYDVTLIPRKRSSLNANLDVSGDGRLLHPFPEG